ncbi:MAG TPA: histidine phosphatase family protein [Candidatus Kaiserbacteria bacterium]|nr:histidine phosphatase family protein [Candidatus Kaiserbacteria bacterium]
MKHLIVVRHGDYYENGLSDDGRKKIKCLAHKLRPYVSGESVVILTSPVGRAYESAGILCSFFGVSCEKYEILWSENSHPKDFAGTLELVRLNNKSDTLILVTHYEYVETFPQYFAMSELGISLSSYLIGKGEAWVIDCQQKVLTHIR